MALYEKSVLVIRKTRLEELVARFGTRGQAKFYLEQSGGDFAAYVDEDDALRRSLDHLRRSLALGLRLQELDRALVPTFVFAPTDLVVTLGQDGLVANTAKYVGAQPIVAVNPDPGRFDGILLPFLPGQVRSAVGKVIEAKARIHEVTLAEIKLQDGQHLLAFNDLFIGARSHVSALYRIGRGNRSEVQSSSGVLISTGAGSTGWLSSVFNMASGVASFCGGTGLKPKSVPLEAHGVISFVCTPLVMPR